MVDGPGVLLVGNVPPQTTAVFDYLRDEVDPWWVEDPSLLRFEAQDKQPDLIIVAGWRHLIPPDVLAIPPRGVVGFHSAKLPEYPGRAPVPWALVRGDRETENTMLYLDSGIDSGDIIDSRVIPIGPYDTPDSLYEWMALTAVTMLREHLPALLVGRAPRQPQDASRRGPLTSKEGWDVYRRLTS